MELEKGHLITKGEAISARKISEPLQILEWLSCEWIATANDRTLSIPLSNNSKALGMWQYDEYHNRQLQYGTILPDQYLTAI